MHYIIFDLEWNQGPEEEQGVGEIVQIGAVKLSDRFETVDELRLYVKPFLYPKLHNRIATLTGIRQQDLQAQGLPFPEAYGRFAHWCGEDCVWMTWSNSDLPVLLENLRLHGVDAWGLPDYCDVQRIFSREIMRSNTQYSLDTALAILKEKGNTAHDALHDARNTAKVCRHLELERYLGEYTGRIFAPMSHRQHYTTRQEMLEDPALRAFCCPWCSGEVACESWVHLGHGSLAAYGLCPEEDEFLVQLFPARRREVFAHNRLVFELTDDLWDIYLDRKEAVQGATP